MTIAQDILDSARGLIDELNVGGVKIPSTDTDMQALEYNGISYINQALRKAYKRAQNIGEYEIDNTAATNDTIYTIYTLPDDFGSLDDVVNLTAGQIVKYKLIGYNKMYVYNTYLGVATVVYNKKPTVITLGTDTVELSNPIAEEFVINFVAARMATTENPQLVNYFEGEADRNFFDMKLISPAEEEDIDNVYINLYGFNGGYYG